MKRISTVSKQFLLRNHHQQNHASLSLTSTTLRLRHNLPPISYPINGGCLPCFSGTTLTHHYNKHHSQAVERLNKLTVGTPFYGAPVEHVIRHTALDATKADVHQVACEHFNHSFFWKCIRPSGTALVANSQLLKQINEQWGSLDAFKKEFTDAALGLFGSGWVYLVIGNNKQLRIWTGRNEETPIAQEFAPVLALDCWEHAYYMDHKNSRANYVQAYWQVVDWSFVSALFDQTLFFLNEEL